MSDNRNDIELVPVPMTSETRTRLVKLAEFLGEHPAQIASKLLRDILLDDELYNSGSDGQALDPRALN